MSVRYRLFFALLPPLTESRRIGLLRDTLGDIDTTVENARLHVTLAITGDHDALPRGAEQAMLAIGAEASAEPFDLSLDRLSAGGECYTLRPSRRPAALAKLQKPLEQHLTRRGLLRGEWKFNPHVTLGYRKPAPSFVRPVQPIGWRAEELVLIRSVVGTHQHVPLARWPLAARQLSLF